MERGGLLAFTAVLASCASAPHVAEKNLGSDGEDVLIMMERARRKALLTLLPSETYPHEGRQPGDGSFIRCEEVDIGELEQDRCSVLESVAAEACARAARVFCTGAPSITERQVGRSVVGAGKVKTDCVQETPAGRKFGTLFCRSKAGTHGSKAVVCTSVEHNVE